MGTKAKPSGISLGPVSLLKGHTDKIFMLSWSLDSRWLVSGGRDGTSRIWDLASAACLTTYAAQPEYILSVAWSPAGDLVASGSSDGSIHIWQPETGKTIEIYRGHTRLCVRWDGRPMGAILHRVETLGITPCWSGKP